MRKGCLPFANPLWRKYSRAPRHSKKSIRSHSLSKGLTETITDIFKPQAPLWACELTPKHIIVTGVNRTRNSIRATMAGALPADTVISSYSEPNIRNAQVAQSMAKQLLGEAGFTGSEIAVVV